MRMACWILALALVVVAVNGFSQTLNLPPRATNALAGSQFANIALNMSQTDRENWVLDQVSLGNVPNWLRTLVPVTISQTISGTPHTLTYYVAPDYLAIGSDTDYFLEPTTPILAQRIANMLNCTLPTRLMVNQIWTNAPVKLDPNLIEIAPTNANNATVAVFLLQDNEVIALRNQVTNQYPLGTLVSGDKKDEVISTLIYNNLTAGVPKPVVIYGWLKTNGAPVQGEVNVHAESYMDYSHGIRMVQMAATLDGVTNYLTNIMADPVLWPLVSDESSGPIAQPYYTIDNPLSPFIITQPRSQTVSPGATVTMSVYVIGDGTITYAWKSNGVPLANMTNAVMTLTNVQAASAATYTVALNNINGSTTSIPAVLKVNTTAFPLLFSDNFDTNSSANWDLFFGSGDGVIDYTADWAYDYGLTPYTFNGRTFVIPPAPNSINGATKAVRFTVNNNDTDAAIAGLNIYPKGKTFGGNFALKFDMWLNYPGSAGGAGAAGTTEFAIFGMNHADTEVNWGATTAASTDGIWFAVDGEGGGATNDYRAYVGNPSGVETMLAVGAASGIASSDNASGIFPALFPANRFETIGAPGKQWVAGELDQSNGVVTWKLDGTIIAQRVNTSNYTSGDVMLGYMDVFSSIASPTNDAYVLFDNMRVEDWSSAPLQGATISSAPTNVVVYAGGSATFSVTPGGSSPFTYQWSFNGTNIAGATNGSFSLANAQATNAGTYGVVVSNVVGSVTTGVQLTVIPPIQYGALTISNGGNFSFSFNGTVGIQYVIQASTNLTAWVTLTNLMDNANPVSFMDSNSAGQGSRFYRVLP